MCSLAGTAQNSTRNPCRGRNICQEKIGELRFKSRHAYALHFACQHCKAIVADNVHKPAKVVEKGCAVCVCAENTAKVRVEHAEEAVPQFPPPRLERLNPARQPGPFKCLAVQDEVLSRLLGARRGE